MFLDVSVLFVCFFFCFCALPHASRNNGVCQFVFVCLFVVVPVMFKFEGCSSNLFFLNAYATLLVWLFCDIMCLLASSRFPSACFCSRRVRLVFRSCCSLFVLQSSSSVNSGAFLGAVFFIWKDRTILFFTGVAFDVHVLSGDHAGITLYDVAYVFTASCRGHFVSLCHLLLACFVAC